MTGDENDLVGGATADREYTDRLNRLSGKQWKRILNVQLPFKMHLRSMHLGRTLDVGCGIGRNLHSLDAGSVGVDHNRDSVETARLAGLTAYTVEEFFADPILSAPRSYDSLLAAHLVEHLTHEQSRTVLGAYVPLLRPGGRAVFMTPQERGYASDATHVLFSDIEVVTDLCTDLGLTVVRTYSFPFPRFAGKAFTYNEFVVKAIAPQ